MKEGAQKRNFQEMIQQIGLPVSPEDEAWLTQVIGATSYIKEGMLLIPEDESGYSKYSLVKQEDKTQAINVVKELFGPKDQGNHDSYVITEEELPVKKLSPSQLALFADLIFEIDVVNRWITNGIQTATLHHDGVMFINQIPQTDSLDSSST
jgi:hypothetical protein